MWIISATITYGDGTTKVGMVVKDRGGFRYFGTAHDAANNDLADMVKAQDMIGYLYDASTAFQELCGNLATNLGWTLRAVVANEITDVVFNATFVDDEEVCFAGTTDNLIVHGTTVFTITHDAACVYANIAADADIAELFAAVAV